MMLAAILACVCATLSGGTAADRDLQVGVEVRAPDGTGLPEVFVSVQTTRGRHDAETDGSGAALITIPVSDVEAPQELVVRLGGVRSESGVSYDRWLQLKQRNAKLTKLMWLPDFVRTQVQPIQRRVDVVLQCDKLAKPVTVSVHEAQSPDAKCIAAYLRDSDWRWLEGDKASDIKVTGLRLGAKNILCLQTAGAQTKIIAIPQDHVFDASDAATPSPGAIQVVLEPTAVDGHLRLAFTNHENITAPGLVDVSNTVSIVKSDGSLVSTYVVREDRLSFLVRLDGPEEKYVRGYDAGLPVGDYWVCPGELPGNVALWKLYDMAIAGNQAQLDAAHVVKFTIAKGQVTEVTLDATQAMAAVRAATGL